MKKSLFGLDWWGRKVLSQIKNNVDFVIIHIYPPGYKPKSNKDEIPAKKLFKIALAAPDQIKNSLMRIAEQIKEITGRDIPLAITEYNGKFVQNNPVPYRHSLGNALLIADLIRVFLTVNVPILCANYWQFSNSYTGLVYNPDYLRGKGKYYKRPNYYILYLYANHFGNILLKTNVQSKAYFQPGYKRVLPSVIFKKVSTSTNLNVSKKIIFPKINFRWIPSCVKIEKHNNSLRLYLNCKNKNRLGIYFLNKIQHIRSNWLYFLEAEMKANLKNSWFFIGIKDQNYKPIQHSKILWGNVNWIINGFDFRTYSNTKNLNIMLFIKSKNKNAIKGMISIRNIKIGELGPTPQYGPTPYISAIASTNEKKDRIYLMVINKNLDEPMKTLIKINGFKFGPVVRAWILNGPSVSATNEHRREHVKIHYREKKVDLGKNYFYFTFEPHSVTALELKKY